MNQKPLNSLLEAQTDETLLSFTTLRGQVTHRNFLKFWEGEKKIE